MQTLLSCILCPAAFAESKANLIPDTCRHVSSRELCTRFYDVHAASMQSRCSNHYNQAKMRCT